MYVLINKKYNNFKKCISIEGMLLSKNNIVYTIKSKQLSIKLINLLNTINQKGSFNILHSIQTRSIVFKTGYIHYNQN